MELASKYSPDNYTKLQYAWIFAWK
jgi:hypothetical protein